MMSKKILLFLPLIFILALCLLLFAGLQQDPKKVASALIGKPMPEFHLADLHQAEKVLNNHNLPQATHLINIWGSWCTYCVEEIPFLTELSQQLPIVGINYRDKTQSAVDFLRKFGDPFTLNINDSKGQLAMALGVDGAPETYLIDRQGIIRYRYSGPINREIWHTEFIPQIDRLRAE